jgi:hypothetical protein
MKRHDSQNGGASQEKLFAQLIGHARQFVPWPRIGNYVPHDTAIKPPIYKGAYNRNHLVAFYSRQL